MVKLILVEYCDKEDNDVSSFELFEDINKAFDFCQKSNIIWRIDLVEVNEEYIYYEDNGTLNYEDNSNLIKRGILSEVY